MIASYVAKGIFKFVDRDSFGGDRCDSVGASEVGECALDMCGSVLFVGKRL